MKKYKEIDKIDETIHKFNREEFNNFMMDYAEGVFSMIKEGDSENLRSVVDDLSQMIQDMKRDFVVPNHDESDINSIQLIINAAQSRLYG